MTAKRAVPKTHKAIIRTLDGLERIDSFSGEPARYIETILWYSKQRLMFPKRRYERTGETSNGLPIYLETETVSARRTKKDSGK